MSLLRLQNLPAPATQLLRYRNARSAHNVEMCGVVKRHLAGDHPALGDGWHTESHPCQSRVFLMLGPIASIMWQIIPASKKSGMSTVFSMLCLLINCSSSFSNSSIFFPLGCGTPNKALQLIVVPPKTELRRYNPTPPPCNPYYTRSRPKSQGLCNDNLNRDRNYGS